MGSDTFLKQWVGNDTPSAQGPAKQHEFSIYVPPLMALLDSIQAADIVDFQADEGVVSVAFCAGGADRHATFVLPAATDDPDGVFRTLAENITADARDRQQITLVASASEIKAASADAILFNNILGCQGSVENIDAILDTAKSVVKPGGYAVVTVPNPDGGKFSSYRCANLPPERAHGGTYDFQMQGEADVFKNLYLTEAGLKDIFARHSFDFVQTAPVEDRPYEGYVSAQPAFKQYLFHKPA